MERARQKKSEKKARRNNKEEDEDEAAREKRLTVETEGTEEEATEILEGELGMEVEEEGEG